MASDASAETSQFHIIQVAQGGEVEDPVAGLDIALQPVFPGVLQERAADPVDDALRHTRGPRRIEDVKRLVEGHLSEVDVARCIGAGEVPGHDGARYAADVGIVPGVGNHHDPGQRRQGGGDLGKFGQGVQGAAVIEIAVGGNQHLGLDLAKTVEDAPNPEVGRARRPGGAEGCGGQHGDDGLGQVGKVARDPVPLPHTRVSQGLGQDGDLVVKLGPGKPPFHPVFPPKDDGVAVVPAAEKILGEVQLRVWKPPGARHLMGVHQDALAPGLGQQIEFLAHAEPELFHFVYGKSVEITRIGEIRPPAPVHGGDESGHVGVRDAGRTGTPEDGRRGVGHRSLRRQAVEAIAVRGRFGGLGQDAGDLGRRRPPVTGVEHGVDGGLGPGEQDLDGAVPAVAHPAPQGQGLGLPGCPVTKAHGLNPAFDHPMDRLVGHSPNTPIINMPATLHMITQMQASNRRAPFLVRKNGAARAAP